MFKEFKAFAMKGNVMDMAVGVVIGGAFGKIVSSLVSDIIMPPIGVVLGGIDLSRFSLTLKQATERSEAVVLNYGMFLNNIINFLIIAFSIFIVVKQLERFKKKEAEKPTTPSEDILLLREIRDAMVKKEQ